MARSAIMNIIIQAATKAGRALIRDFGEVQNLQVSLKGAHDYAKLASQNAGNLILKELHKARPEYHFLLENSKEITGKDSQHCFTINPLDGATNFLHGIPLFAISISLQRQGKVVAGLIYNPALDELYTAEKGIGAFFNDRRLRIANRRKLQESVIGIGNPSFGEKGDSLYFLKLRQTIGELAQIRIMGASTLGMAYTAAGRFDGFWEENVSSCNLGSSLLIIRESGGFISESPIKSIIAGNNFIHSALLKKLQDI
ncbi:MAG: myo-inositol-1(or 4)-monophosphatase [Candidatus Tokpelaia sp. JSC161]|jgi:myo-inositol-1(or 4)-monophosphatase|nr:MAG: myo-inositol-1(or 4)-monophosphatase [Candidatus Tokpelaia sp. JSC161]